MRKVSLLIVDMLLCSISLRCQCNVGRCSLISRPCISPIICVQLCIFERWDSRLVSHNGQTSRWIVILLRTVSSDTAHNDGAQIGSMKPPGLEFGALEQKRFVTLGTRAPNEPCHCKLQTKRQTFVGHSGLANQARMVAIHSMCNKRSNAINKHCQHCHTSFLRVPGGYFSGQLPHTLQKSQTGKRRTYFDSQTVAMAIAMHDLQL